MYPQLQGEIGQDPFRPKRITYIPATTLELYLGDRDQTTVIWLERVGKRSARTTQYSREHECISQCREMHSEKSNT